MSQFFWMREDRAVVEKNGGYVNAAHRWGLPGATCHTCGVTWASSGHTYPCVDLSQLPEHAEFLSARPEPFPEFARLRELVRPLAPPKATLPPGTLFGPLVGTATGRLAAFEWLTEVLLVRRDALERLQGEGLRGMRACPTALRFRQKNPPEFLELQVEPHGRLHPDCLPPDVPPPCVTCGRHAFRRPDEPILDAASLPMDLDLFRGGNFATMVVVTARFMEAVRRLDLDGVTFRELPTR
ncbi:SitI6 family double-CXXCG motif immunity protein [Pyxidicoccus xibeiensis]|uniref:SitI6 family double-CXXCG motif immunity protein n=1 Tax=Pyxidicoccus xibeiensis TaxID=2906759 RepID=UPI0020A825CA|nr:double-CXXCG motif protein [Pyxidicoccus xibeiensis]MCP3142312.1 double-CXXCG motif protein [Pyxidicoccus xibeiensis]